MKRKQTDEEEEKVEHQEPEIFEDLIFEGILNIVFLELYSLPITGTSFSCAFVNKRFNRIFNHPVQMFIRGGHDGNLTKFPPSYYKIRENTTDLFSTYADYSLVPPHRVIRGSGPTNHIYSKISQSIGMSRQLAQVGDQDVERLEFVQREMLAHSFFVLDWSSNKWINEIFSKMKRRRRNIYVPENDFDHISEEIVIDHHTYVKVVTICELPLSLFASKMIMEDIEFAKSVLQSKIGCLAYIPEQNRTEEICKIAVKTDGLQLYAVPLPMRTEEVCKIAVKSNGLSITFVPSQCYTAEICRLAIQQTTRAIQEIINQRSQLTEEIAKIILEKRGLALQHIPPNLVTEEMIRIAVAQDAYAIVYAKPGILTYEICASAVRSHGELLEFVPFKLRKEEICRIAIENNRKSISLKFVPHSVVTEEMCIRSIELNSDSIEWVPDCYKTEELCKAAIEQKSSAFQFIPDTLKTNEICKLGVEKDGLNLKLIPSRSRTKEICDIAINENTEAVWFVPIRLQNEEMWRTASLNNKAIQRKLIAQRTESSVSMPPVLVPVETQICEPKTNWARVVEQTGLHRVPMEYMSEELCKLAVITSGYELSHVPPPWLTEAVCRLAVTMDGSSNLYIPERFRNLKFLMLVLISNIEAAADFPNELIQHAIYSQDTY